MALLVACARYFALIALPSSLSAGSDTDDWRLYTAGSQSAQAHQQNCWDISFIQFFSCSDCNCGAIVVSSDMQMASGTAGVTGLGDFSLGNAFSISGVAGLRSAGNVYDFLPLWIGIKNVEEDVKCIRFTQGVSTVNLCRPQSNLSVQVKQTSSSTWQTVRIVPWDSTMDGPNTFGELVNPSGNASTSTSLLSTSEESTSPTASTMMTTTLAPTMLSCRLRMRVSNAINFLKESTRYDVMRQAIAAFSEVLIEYVRDVTINSASRRLFLDPDASHKDHRRLQTGDVDVSWMIVIPPDAPNNMTVRVTAERFDAKTMSEITQTVNAIITTNNLDYDIDALNVEWEYIVADTSKTEEQAQTEDKSGLMLLVIILVAAATAIAGITALAFLMVGRSRASSTLHDVRPCLKQGVLTKALDRLAESDVREWLSPPSAISAKQAEDLQMLSQAIHQDVSFNTSVAICYSPGQRPTDAEGYGPGCYFALAVQKSLYDNGVPCFSELMLNCAPAERHEAFRAHFSERVQKPCKVLIVLETRALYEDRQALQDIYCAQKANIECFPLRLGDDLPRSDEQWKCIDRTDLEGITMLADVQVRFGKLNSIPSPPYTIQQQPQILNDLVVDLKKKIGSEVFEPKQKHLVPSVVGTQEKTASCTDALLDHRDTGKPKSLYSSHSSEDVKPEKAERKKSKVKEKHHSAEVGGASPRRKIDSSNSPLRRNESSTSNPDIEDSLKSHSSASFKSKHSRERHKASLHAGERSTNSSHVRKAAREAREKKESKDGSAREKKESKDGSAKKQKHTMNC